MNFVFISPAYPITYTYFCERLSDLGVNVLGIGDYPYDELDGELKNVLTEYYYVDSLEDYDKVYRACAFFIHKYGRIDWLESMNEYWLQTDARLRTDFNIGVGTRDDKISELVKKSEMKRVFISAGIPTARQHLVSTDIPAAKQHIASADIPAAKQHIASTDIPAAKQHIASDLSAGKAFTAEVGYPVIVKPDTGVGANGAMKIKTEEELIDFYNDLPEEPYVMEEFLEGDICTYDAVIDSKCEPLFESMCTYPPVIDSVNNDEDIHYYTSPEMPEKLRLLGRKAVKAFGADRRFVHFEFIQLKKSYDGIGEAGDFALMEVNMRPAGGHDPDMMNVAQSVDVFRIYAEMVTSDKRLTSGSGEKYYCAYAARKDGHAFTHSHEDIMDRYGDDIVIQEEMPPIDWPSMGRYVYMARFKDKKDMDAYFNFVLG